MKMPNQRAHGLLQRTGYGGIDGNARPQPMASSFRNAAMHQPRHPVEPDAEQRPNGESRTELRMKAEDFKRGGRAMPKEGSAAEEKTESKAYEAKEDESREGRKRGGRTVVNVVVGHGGQSGAGDQEKKAAAMQGMQLGARLAAAKLSGGAGGPPGMPMPPPGGGGPAAGGPGPAPMPGMKRGGGLC